ncbi:MAG: cobalt ECF transporter T component CbiQ [Candidatus Eisenbacteria bacterium]|nr:cobalt ECF transporter T component CbiQ [Candidatus Eisenbacteria bacterium]
MDLFAIDRYCGLTSPIHRLNPVVTLVSFLTFVVVVVLVPVREFAPLLAALFSLSCIALVSKVPLRFILRRSLAIVPFAIAIGAFNLLGRGVDLMIHHSASGSSALDSAGVPAFLNVVLKSFVCVLGMTILVSTTGSANLLNAMRKIGVPEGLTAGTCFLSRYAYVVADELFRMKRSRDSRRAGSLPWIAELRFVGSLVGVLFIRSYERAERVHVAMCSRGFDGTAVVSTQFRTSRRDVLFPLFLLGPLLLILLISNLI